MGSARPLEHTAFICDSVPRPRGGRLCIVPALVPSAWCADETSSLSLSPTCHQHVCLRKSINVA